MVLCDDSGNISTLTTKDKIQRNQQLDMAKSRLDAKVAAGRHCCVLTGKEWRDDGDCESEDSREMSFGIETGMEKRVIVLMELMLENRWEMLT